MASHENNLDRRMFLKGAGIGALGIAGAGALAACTSDAQSTPKTEDAPSAASAGTEPTAAANGTLLIGLKDSDVELGDIEITETRDVDVVVVGAGLTGASAALAAAEEGLSVVCLEKRGITGGTSAHAEGMFGLNSTYQKEQGYEGDPEEYFLACEEYHHWTNNARIARRFLNTAGGVVDWCVDRGMVIREVLANWSVVPAWHVYEGKGRAVIDGFIDRATQKGAEVLTNTPAVQLLSDENGVTGVIARDADGNAIQFNAKAVVLASGGYPCNREMIETYSGARYYESDDARLMDHSWFGSEGRTGDGILMGQTANADLFRIGAMMADFSAVGGQRMDEENVVRNILLVAPVLIVNEQAKRFTSEALIDDFVAWGEQMFTQAKNFNVCDYDFVVRQSEGVIADCCGTVPAGTPYPNAVEEIDEYIEAGDLMVWKADTIEELAEKMGVDPKNLQDTVDHYNEMCDNGLDEDFGKRADYLIPVKKAPFYAVETHPMYMTTVGGLRVDERSRVLDTPGDVIKGLYAAGCDAGGLYGYSYDVKVAVGSQQNYCVASALWAVEDIMENVVGNGDGHTSAATDLV